MPLPAVSAAVASGLQRKFSRIIGAIFSSGASVRTALFLSAEGILRSLAVPVAVGERTVPAQPFVGHDHRHICR